MRIDKLGECTVGCDFGAPEVLCGNERLPAVFFRQRDAERNPTVKREILQNPLAEAVYRINRGLVKMADGSGQAQLQARLRFFVQRLPQQVKQKIVAAFGTQDFRLPCGIGNAL